MLVNVKFYGRCKIYKLLTTLSCVRKNVLVITGALARENLPDSAKSNIQCNIKLNGQWSIACAVRSRM